MSWAWFFLGVFAIILASRFFPNHRSHARLPPGPRGFPIVGNVLDMPREHLGREFAELSATYGEVIYLRVFGQPMIILGSYQAARDLLDKHSANFSSRPSSVMAQLTGLDCMTVLKDYGPEWRKHRRAFGRWFNAEAVALYNAVHRETAKGLLRELIQAPKDISKIIELSLTSHIIRITYGIVLDRYMYGMIERVLDVCENILTPGRFAVEALPFLRFVPSWFPGAYFKHFAKKGRRDVTAIVDELFYSAKHDDTSTTHDSVVVRLLEDSGALGVEDEIELERVVKGMAITAYLGGIDTTIAALQAFFLSMAMYPEAQRKAQAELDVVVGPDRLPDFSDQAALPYMAALLREVLRWHVVTPIGVPHCTSEDSEYNGYFIPAGTIVSANLWAMARDPGIYPDPEQFIPERFLDKEGRLDFTQGDPTDFVYGFGRRICPGRQFAEASMFIICASVLHMFDIRPPVDAHGNSIVLQYRASTAAAISHPAVYDYVIKPRRSEHMAELLAET